MGVVGEGLGVDEDSGVGDAGVVGEGLGVDENSGVGGAGVVGEGLGVDENDIVVGDDNVRVRLTGVTVPMIAGDVTVGENAARELGKAG